MSGILCAIIIAISLFYFGQQKAPFKESISIRNKTLPSLQETTTDVNVLYSFYTNLSRPHTEDYSVYVVSPYDDEYLQSLILNWSLEDVVVFVQDIPYESESGEYPKYPIETLVENCGDCEDKSILCASLLDLLGYNTSLLRYPSHMAVRANDTFIEVTQDLEIGIVPKKYRDVVPVVYNISCYPILVHSWNGTTYSYSDGFRYVEINATVDNFGCADADDITLCLCVGDFHRNVSLSLDAFSSKIIEFVVEVPEGEISIEIN